MPWDFCLLQFLQYPADILLRRLHSIQYDDRAFQSLRRFLNYLHISVFRHFPELRLLLEQIPALEDS